MNYMNLRNGDKLLCIKTGIVEIVHYVENGCVTMKNSLKIIPRQSISSKYRFILDNNSTEKITCSIEKIEFMGHAKFIAWVGYQAKYGNPYNTVPTEDQLDSSMNSALFSILKPDATVEDIHDNWVSHKLEQGWVYGKTKDMNLKTHPCIVKFNELSQEEKDKDFAECLMNKAYSDLWDRIFS